MTYNLWVISLIVASQLFSVGYGANILALLGCASPSHQIWNYVIIDELATKGHNITVLTVDLPKKPVKNVHYIHLEKTYSAMYEDPHGIDISDYVGQGPFSMIGSFYEFAITNCRGIMKSDGLQILLNYPKDFKFDLIINDFTTATCLSGFIHKFNYPPTVGITAFKIPPYLPNIIGGHNYPAYIPYYSTFYTSKMNFIERFHNTMITFAEYLYRKFVVIPEMDKMMYQHFDENTPSGSILERHMSIALVNTHPAMDFAQPLPPNVIEIGGVHIKEPKPLDSKLEDYIGKSKKGGIFISLGTNMKSEDIGEKRIQAFIETARKLPDYNFMWKIESNLTDNNVPKNLLIRPWFMQRDLLGHPKLKLFVTHAGGLSTQESIWFQVPTVGIPLFGDQPRNNLQCVMAGVAETVSFENLENELSEKITKVLTTPSYRDKITVLSKLFRDRPMHPLQTAIWYIEFVLRNGKDVGYLESPTLELGYIAANSIDVIFVALFLLVLIIYLFVKIVLVAVHLMIRKEKPKKKLN